MSLSDRNKHIMRNILYCIIALLALTTACKEEQLTPEEAALKSAKETVTEGYNSLIAGRYDSFIDCKAGGDTLPSEYREQLAVAYKQFMAQQQEDHGGIKSFEVSNMLIDSVADQIHVFLILRFGDNTKEEIIVPMVECNGEWKMK